VNDKTDESEAERLAGLHATGLLDTPAEEDFDAIARLAAAICEAPIALVSLVDAERQFFKAAHGIDARETPRDQSVCAYTMHGDGLLEIPDTLADPRTADNPLTCDGEVDMHFYAGAPIVIADGTRLGALCVLDRQARRLTALQRQTLETLARQVSMQIDLRIALSDANSAAAALRAALKREEMLRREIDHRVKNSLQQVSALLRLQARGADAAETRQALAEAERRVGTIAAIHAELHDGSAGESVEMQSYLRRLARNLQATMPRHVALKLETEALCLPISKATGLAVIANEFVANALKHAFPGGARGEIGLDLAKCGDTIRARFHDTGIGYRGDGTGGLGTRIMRASAAQIGGEIDFDTEPGQMPGPMPGTVMELRFPAQSGASM